MVDKKKKRSVTDITAMKQENQVLQSECEQLTRDEEKFRAIFDSANDAIFVHDIKTGAILDVNRKMCQMYGYTPDEMRDIMVEDLSAGVAPYSQTEAVAWIRKAVQGQPQIFEWYAKRKSGELFWVEVNLKRTSIGGEERLLALVRDITERKRSQQALKDSEEKYRDFFENAQIGLFRTSIDDGKVLDCNDFFARIMGYDTREECCADYVVSEHYVYPQMRNENLDYLKKHGYIKDAEVQITRRDGSAIWSSFAARYFPEKGYVEGAAVDISERKRAEEALCESEEKYSTLVEQALIGTAIVQDDVLKFANSAISTITGYSHEELIGMPFINIIAAEWKDRINNRYRRRLQGEEVKHSYELKIEYKYGTIKDVEVFIDTIHYQSRPALMVLVHDITERKNADRLLGESEKRFRSMIENSSDMITIVDREGGVLYESPSIEKILGYEAEELLGENVFDFVHPGDRERAQRVFQETLNNPLMAITVECRFRHKNGEWRILSACGSNLLNDTAVAGVVINSRDITEYRDAEKALRQSEREKSLILDSMIEHVVYQDLSMQVLWVNNAAAESVNTPPEQLVGRQCYEIWHGRQKVCEYCPVERALRTGKVHRREIMSPDGRWWFIRGYPVRDGENNIVGAVEITLEITAKKQAEEEARASQLRYRAVVEDQTELICRFLPNGMLTFVNEAYCRYFGKKREEMIGRSFLHLIPESDRERIEGHLAALSEKKPAGTIEHRIAMPNGEVAWQQWTTRVIMDKGRLIEYQVVGRDITGRKKAELELMQAQKLASIGQLAAGVAHEINNPLSALSGEIQWLLEQKGNDELIKSFRFMNKVSRRIAGIVDNLLTFSRESSTGIRENSSCSDLIDRTLHLMKRRFKLQNITITKKIDTVLPAIFVNKGEIEQVFMNILLNSLDALPEGGNITIAAAVINARRKEKESIEITFSDTGEGIKKEHLPRIFDPFFTTKAPGAGTGLGLSVSHGIIKNHNGLIKANSELGKGTEVIVRLPVSRADN